MRLRNFHIIPLALLISCSDDLSKTNLVYSNFISDQMTRESDLEVNEAYSVLEQTLDDTVITSLYVDKLVEALNWSNAEFENAFADLNNAAIITDLEKCLLSSMHECSNWNKKYSIDFDTYDFSNSNPMDSAWFTKTHRSFDFIKKQEINKGTKLALLKSIQREYYYNLHDKFNPLCCFCYWHSEPIIFADQTIWHQDEKAWIIVSESTFDLDEKTVYRINGKEFTGASSLLAPTKKGLHEIKGEIGIKEKGELRWVPFSRRILIQ